MQFTGKNCGEQQEPAYLTCVSRHAWGNTEATMGNFKS